MKEDVLVFAGAQELKFGVYPPEVITNGVVDNTTDGKDTASDQLIALDKRIKELTKELNIQKEEYKARESKTIETMAVFVALFTYISVNVNIFTRVSDVLSAIWFMLIMTTCCFLVLSFVSLILNPKKSRKFLQSVSLVFFFLLFLIALTFAQTGWNPKLNPVETLPTSTK